MRVLGWATFFDVNGLKPRVVVCEDLNADPRPACAAIRRSVSVTPPQMASIEDVPIERQSNESNDEWIRQIRLGLTMSPPTPGQPR